MNKMVEEQDLNNKNKNTNRWLKLIGLGAIIIFMTDWMFINHFNVQEGKFILEIDPDYKALLNVIFNQVLGGLIALVGVKIKDSGKD